MSWFIGTLSKSRLMRIRGGEFEKARLDSASGWKGRLTRYTLDRIHLPHALLQEPLNPFRKRVPRSGCNEHGPVHPHWIRKTWLQRWQTKVCFQSSNSPGQVLLLNW